MERTIITVLAAAFVLAAGGQANGAILFYSTEDGSGFSHLYSYDTAAGAPADRGLLHEHHFTTDLAVDPAGTLYGVVWSDALASGTSLLLHITPGGEEEYAQWSRETVHGNKMEKTVAGAVIDADGDLYICSASGVLQKLIYNTGKSRWDEDASGELGAGAADLAFSADGATLYAALAGGVLATVDFDPDSPTFAQATVIGAIGYEAVTGLAVVDGVLYGTTNTADGYGQSYLIQIDPLTAQPAVVADLGAGVWGLAGPGPQPLPEPAALALVLFGAAGLCTRHVRRTRER